MLFTRYASYFIADCLHSGIHGATENPIQVT